MLPKHDRKELRFLASLGITVFVIASQARSLTVFLLIQRIVRMKVMHRAMSSADSFRGA